MKGAMSDYMGILKWPFMLAAFLLAVTFTLNIAHASQQEENSQVIQAFTAKPAEQPEEASLEDSAQEHTKRVVMFAMGIPLLILLFATGGLGIAMGIYGKQVFVAHMICAGLTMTLALAHAVVGLVWFYPF